MTHHLRHCDGPHEPAQGIEHGLGWFSVALGLTKLAAPQAIARSLGMRGSERMIQACGLREIVTGAGILAARNPAPWLWARAAGDGLDLAALAAGLHDGNRQRRNVQLAMAATAGVTLLDIFCAQKMGEAAKQRFLPMVDYSDRDGFPKGLAASRGAASDFDPGKDFRTPEALQPWQDGKAPEGLWKDTGSKGKTAGTGHGSTGARKAAANSGGASLQQAAGSHERDDAFKTGPSFTGKGNEGP